MTDLRVRVTFLEEVLGTASSDPNVHSEFIASKAPDAPSREEEVAALGVDAVIEKGRTVFPRNAEGTPIFWNYQIRGYFKDSCGFLRNVPDTKSSKVKAFKKKIDGTIFVLEREIPITLNGELGECQRPLRAQTMQGDRVALANSETIPAGSTMIFTVRCLIDDDIKLVREWLDYGIYHGMGQWRNSGKGTLVWEELDADGNVIGGNKNS